MKIKKNDTVLVIGGKDRGKTGKVERALPRENKLSVSGVNVAKKHVKPSKKNPQGGIMEIFAPLSISNVQIVCPKCNKPTRIGSKNMENKKVRICKKCGEEI